MMVLQLLDQQTEDNFLNSPRGVYKYKPSLLSLQVASGGQAGEEPGAYSIFSGYTSIFIFCWREGLLG